MAAFEEDFLQTITSVHWGNADLMAISYYFQSDSYYPFPFQPIPGLAYDQIRQDVLQLTVAPFRQGFPIENPISAEMLSDLVMFRVREPTDTSTQMLNQWVKPLGGIFFEIKLVPINGHALTRLGTVFINLTKVKAATKANRVRISATLPTVTGRISGPTLNTFVDGTILAGSASSAQAVFAAQVAARPDFVSATSTPVAFPIIPGQWFVYGTYMSDLSLPRSVSVEFTGYTWGKKRDKKAKVAPNTGDNAAGWVPPIPDPIAISRRASQGWIYGQVAGFPVGPHFNDLFSFVVDLQTLALSHP